MGRRILARIENFLHFLGGGAKVSKEVFMGYGTIVVQENIMSSHHNQHLKAKIIKDQYNRHVEILNHLTGI